MSFVDPFKIQFVGCVFQMSKYLMEVSNLLSKMESGSSLSFAGGSDECLYMAALSCKSSMPITHLAVFQSLKAVKTTLKEHLAPAKRQACSRIIELH